MHVAKRLIPGELIAIFVLSAFLVTSGIARAAGDPMNTVAERYVHLVLALGQHDPDYVDAFYGPAEWKTQAEKEKKSLDEIGAAAEELSATLNGNRPSPQSSPWPGRGDGNVRTTGSDLVQLRREYLQKTNFRAGGASRDVAGREIKVR